jgi:hypothetical protein
MLCKLKPQLAGTCVVKPPEPSQVSHPSKWTGAAVAFGAKCSQSSLGDAYAAAAPAVPGPTAASAIPAAAIPLVQGAPANPNCHRCIQAPGGLKRIQPTSGIPGAAATLPPSGRRCIYPPGGSECCSRPGSSLCHSRMVPPAGPGAIATLAVSGARRFQMS